MTEITQERNQERKEPLTAEFGSQLGSPPIKGLHNEIDLFEEVTLPDKRILSIINLVLQTAFLKSQTKPISLLIMGQPGSGKSRILAPLSRLDYVEYATDITPTYLVEFLRKVERGEKKFLVIPDYTNCTAHSKSTRATLTAYLRNMTEEGVSNISAYRLEFKSKAPVRAGLITAVTTSSFKEFKTAWRRTGFLSRLLPFSFTHSLQTKNEIMKAIDSRLATPLGETRLNVVKRPKEVIWHPELLEQLRVYEEYLGKWSDATPYRAQIQLNALVEALAVRKGDSEIKQEHVSAITQLCHWVNHDFREL